MKLTTDDRKALQGAVRVLVEILQKSPEVPDTIEQWPDDDTHLQGDVWEDEGGDHWKYLNAVWQIWNPAKREWEDWGDSYSPGYYPPLTRTTDPAQPRRFDSLADIPEDTERAVGKYQSYPCELARSPLSGTGWMMRVDHLYILQQWVEYMDLDEDNLTDIEEVIDHE